MRQYVPGGGGFRQITGNGLSMPQNGCTGDRAPLSVRRPFSNTANLPVDVPLQGSLHHKRLSGGGHVVDAQDGDVLCGTEGRDQGGGEIPLLCFALARDFAQKALAGMADQQAAAKAGKGRQIAQNGEIVSACLAKAQIGIKNHAGTINARSLQVLSIWLFGFRHLDVFCQIISAITFMFLPL